MMRMMRLSECYEEIEYRRGKVIRRRRGSSGNVRLSHLLMWVFCLNKCCEPKQRFLHVWHGIDHQIIIDNAVDEWRGRLRACAGKRRTLRATIVTIFSHMRRDVSVLCQQFLDSFFLEITTNSNFQISQGSAATYWRYDGTYYLGFVGNLLLFPTVKEF